MKKIIGTAIGILMVLFLPYIFQFAFWLIEIDNTDFGFPLWLDLGIDFVAGIFALLLAETLFYKKCDRSTAIDIFSIIIGVIIGLTIHLILRFWFIWIPIVLIIVGTFITLKIQNSKY